MPGLTNQRYQQDTSELLEASKASGNWLFRALDVLKEILSELRIIKVHMASVTDEEVKYDDIEEELDRLQVTIEDNFSVFLMFRFAVAGYEEIR